MTVTGDAKVDKLLSKMTLDEKLTMIEGQKETATDREYQAGDLPGIDRLGIPSLKLSDGPPGIITKRDSPGLTATMGLAATFSAQDAKQNGVVIGRDAKALGQDVALEPFVNMDRDTTFSRGFNTFGEDPLLTGQTGAQQITGIQSQGTMAQVKHYIAYDGSNNVNVDEQTLHEIYLQPFTDAVNAGVSSIMCSYNAVNSAQACGNSQTMTDILRNELGFKGFTTSDWGANHSTSYINAGLDMEMPGGAFFTKTALKAAIKNGTVQESRITEAVGRILYEYDQFGLLDGKSTHNVTKVPTAADEKVIQTTGEDGATLLQNDGNALPLDGSSSLALIGPGAGQTIATDGGGEKSGGLFDQQTGTYQVLQQQLGSSAKLDYAVADDMTGTPVPASALSHDGKAGLLRTDTATGSTSTDKTVNFTAAKDNTLPAGSAHTWTGTLTAPESGSYYLDLQTLGAVGSLSIDGKSVASLSARYGALHPSDGNGPLPTTDGLANARAAVTLSSGSHTISITQTTDVSAKNAQVRLAWDTPSQQQADHDAAVKAAKKAKTAVVFAWSSGDLTKPLPNGQDQLISDVAAVNPNTVVVLNSSQPVAMPWLSKVKSVLEMWYPGDRGGYATANVLLGKVNPGGKLPFTWPASYDQEPGGQPDTHPERTSAGASPAGQLCTGGSGGGSSGANANCITTYSKASTSATASSTPPVRRRSIPSDTACPTPPSPIPGWRALSPRTAA